MRIENKNDNITEIMRYINGHEIKNNRITIANKNNETLMTIEDVVGVYTSERDSWDVLHFEVLGREESMCRLYIDVIDSYDTDKQEIRLRQ